MHLADPAHPPDGLPHQSIDKPLAWTPKPRDSQPKVDYVDGHNPVMHRAEHVLHRVPSQVSPDAHRVLVRDGSAGFGGGGFDAAGGVVTRASDKAGDTGVVVVAVIGSAGADVSAIAGADGDVTGDAATGTRLGTRTKMSLGTSVDVARAGMFHDASEW